MHKFWEILPSENETRVSPGQKNSLLLFPVCLSQLLDLCFSNKIFIYSRCIQITRIYYLNIFMHLKRISVLTSKRLLSMCLKNINTFPLSKQINTIWKIKISHVFVNKITAWNFRYYKLN